MVRRQFLRTAAWGAAYLSGGRLLAQGAARAGLNVLWLGVDDLRCNLGCYGDRAAITPNLDKLAQRGTIFTRAYVQQAVCSASRATILTGCRPDTTTVDYPYNPYFLNEFLPAHPSLPAYFHQHGYELRVGGKIHHEKGDLTNFPYARPWQMPGSWRGYADPANQAKEKSPEGGAPSYECLDVPDTAYRDGRLAESVVDALEQYRPGGAPFFYAAGFVKPHLPFTAPKRYWDLYDRARFVLPEHRFLAPNVTPLARASGEMPTYDGQIDFHDEARLRLLTHAYYACTSYTDANIGKVIDALDRRGLAERTIIMLWSDHGFHLGENESFGKHTCFEVATRSPLMVVAPGRRAGQVCPALCEYVDLFPTLCDLAGLPLPDYLEGTSLGPLLDDPRGTLKQAAFSQWPRGKHEGYSLRTDRYRYTEWRTRPPAAGDVTARELYDHQTDPHESRNLADSSPELVATLAAQLKAGWRAARGSG